MATAAKTKPKKSGYDESSIRNLQFPESVRERPTLFIGPVDERGVLHILKEILDNVVDEALAGRANACSVFIGKDGSYWVADNGGGIPTGKITIVDPMGKAHKVSAFKAAVGILDTSGKYDGSSGYNISRGVNGIGQKASNALSKEFEAWTCYKGEWQHIGYKRGVETEPVGVIDKPTKFPTVGTPKRGTMIRFVPDQKIFSAKTFPYKWLHEWATIAAFFTPNFKINVVVEGDKTRQYYYPNGPIDYIKARVAKLKAETLGRGAFVISGDKHVDCVVQFTNHSACEFHGFTNGLRNPEGGVHVNAFYKALRASLESFVKRGQDFKVDDLKEGIVGIINAKLPRPQFDSQTKEKLVDVRADQPTLDQLTKALTTFFAKNKSLAASIIEQAVKLRDLHNKFKLSKTATREIKKLMKTGFPTKAFVAPNVPAHQRELLLLEGESAAGPAKLARMPWQEVLPLKGKPLNSMRAQDSRVFASEEVVNVLAMIGFNPDAEDPLAKMRVGKIITMSDPDPDGPLHGDTKVVVKYDGEDHLLTMKELANDPWMNREYKILSWNGKTAIATEAHGCRVTTVTDKQVTIKLIDDTKILCAPNHQFCMFSLKSDPRSSGLLNVGFHCVQAQKLKAGDRLARLVPRQDGKKIDMVEARIASVKIKTVPMTEYYCLTVPAYHCFALESGIVSKNCHINSLLLTLFAKYMPKLYERKMVYVSMLPQFFALHEPTDTLVTGSSSKEVEDKLAKAKLPRMRVQHVKGLGEVNASVLKRLAFDPATRTLAQVQPWKNSKDHTEFKLIMGDSVESRRKLLDI
jgi:DNA gyrase subunit B